MSQPKSPAVAIAGARRQRQGLGPFVARFLHEEGARIAGVYGRSLASASVAAAELKSTLGVETVAYPDLPTLLRETRPDGIAICTSTEAHQQHLLDAADAGVAALCEKPLLWRDGDDPVRATERVLERFEAAQRGIILNTQWPHLLAPFFTLYPEVSKQPLHSFEMYLAPSAVGLDMVVESVSHPLSLLFALVGPGRVEGRSCRYQEESGIGQTHVSFDFHHATGTVAGLVHLKTEPNQPRNAWFALNGKRVDREIRPPHYGIALRSDARTIAVDDPLRLQIRNFLLALRGARSFDSREILRCHSEGLTAFVRAFRQSAER